MVVPAGEVIDYDYFGIGGSTEISGIVNGEVYSAGGLVLVDVQILGMLAFITLLPFLGAMVTFLALLSVLGALLLTKKEVYIAARNQRMI